MDLVLASGKIDLRDWDFELDDPKLNYIIGGAATRALRSASPQPWASLIGMYAFSEPPDDGSAGPPVHPLVIELNFSMLGEEENEDSGPCWRFDLRELVDVTFQNTDTDLFWPKLAEELRALAAHIDAEYEKLPEIEVAEEK